VYTNPLQEPPKAAMAVRQALMVCLRDRFAAFGGSSAPTRICVRGSIDAWREKL
jgi:hypothetical protein